MKYFINKNRLMVCIFCSGILFCVYVRRGLIRGVDSVMSALRR